LIQGSVKFGIAAAPFPNLSILYYPVNQRLNDDVANVNTYYLSNVLEGPAKRDKHQQHRRRVKKRHHVVGVTIYNINHQHYHLQQEGVGLSATAISDLIGSLSKHKLCW